MTPEVGIDLERLTWGNEHLTVHLSTAPDDAPRLLGLTLPGDEAPAVRRSALPVVEVAVVDEGRVGTSGKRHVDGTVSHRLRLTSHETGVGQVPGAQAGTLGPWWTLEMRDHLSGIEVTTTLSLPGDDSTLRVVTTVRSTERTVVLEHVSSLVLGGLASGGDWEELVLWQAANPWSGEFRWQQETLGRRGLVDVGMSRFAQVGSKNRVSLTSVGAWSTSEHLPMGALEDPGTGRVLAWQVESNSTWHWEIADRYDDLYLLASGPTALEHGWSVTLEPGQSFTAVPAAVTLVRAGGPATAERVATATTTPTTTATTPPTTRTRVGESGTASAVGAALTTYRRAVRRPHDDHHGLPVVYNDFLNGLMSDPTTDRVLPLVEASADLGAEIYCMDAGWYDDEGGGWWDSVGEWAPSVTRFPGGGLAAVVDEIHRSGMKPGLWLEPEVVGVRSPLARTLPADAFFRRHGRRVGEWGRHQLDLRHPAARGHLDEVVDRLVGDFDLGYLKLDYNVDTGAGTQSPGDDGYGHGLLEHGRAMLDWVASIMDRHPRLVVEGCAAGGSRTDGASGAVFPVQSLTDQQDMLLVPPIAAASGMAIPPEQAGVWASLDGAMDDETIAFVLASAMTSRIHLAGRVDTLDASQRDLVRSALATYSQTRAAIPRSLPVWPLGLPSWRDDLVVSGLRDQHQTLLVVHRRAGAASVSIPLPEVSSGARVETIFPGWAAGGATLVSAGGTTSLDVVLPAAPSAQVLRITDV